MAEDHPVLVVQRLGRRGDEFLHLMDLGSKRVVHKMHCHVLNDHEVRDGTDVVHRWMDENYADSMLMGLRRVLDKDRKSFSLIKLLDDFKKHHTSLSFEKYMELWRRRREGQGDLFPQMLYKRRF